MPRLEHPSALVLDHDRMLSLGPIHKGIALKRDNPVLYAVTDGLASVSSALLCHLPSCADVSSPLLHLPLLLLFHSTSSSSTNSSLVFSPEPTLRA
ncbi:hypothetical protein EYF80_037776 [Liparis tanakae]|uniref:Uncharacterized protein n=1 Tax=Liparis tanakae TaxID=230148 RepID=A0A4Z2GH76_9TELE|nr:hypothetical protein EYF80_037776 [Liparis tanakae]